MKLRSIAIDDEPLALELLEDNISKVPFLQLLSGFNKPIEALQYLQSNEVDLVFIDIQMPGLTGLQLIQSLPKKPLFILVTAYEQFALQGYELDVVDYLVKPVRFDRFLKACTKALEIHEVRNKSTVNNGQERDHMFIQADYMMVRVNFDDIQWIESLKDYLRIHMTGSQKPIVARMSMKSIEEQLPATKFLRIHKSYIVATAAITAVQKGTVYLGDIQLPVGDLYKESLQRFIGQ
jgi:two-component system LytT family response regulator